MICKIEYPSQSLLFIRKEVILHIINSPYNFCIQNFLQNSDRVQFRFQPPERCIIKHLRNRKLYSIVSLGTDLDSFSL